MQGKLCTIDVFFYQMSVDEESADGVALSTVLVELWLLVLGRNAVGSQARIFSTALFRMAHQPRRSSRVSADSRCHSVVMPVLRF